MRNINLPINSGRRVFVSVRMNNAAPPYKSSMPSRVSAYPGQSDLAPFFKITDDDGTASSFLKALTDFRPDAARCFISKNFAASIDVYDLAATFEGAAACKMVCAEFEGRPKHCKVKSVLVTGGQDASCAVVHLRMIREPDSVSNWKICSVEKES